MKDDQHNQFLQVFEFVDDDSKPGRVVSSSRIGDVSMARVKIEPGVTIGNHYHAQTRMMVYVGIGKVRGVFEKVDTKERVEMDLSPGKEVVHCVENIAHAFTNTGDEPAILIVFSNKQLRSGDTYPYPLVKE